MSNPLFVGIDCSLRTNTVVVVNSLGQVLSKPKDFQNSLPDSQELEKFLLQNLSSSDFDSLLIATEATSFYDWHIAEFLATSQKLSPWKQKVFRFNAKLVANFKKALPPDDKTDPNDAVAIAQRLRFGHRPAPHIPNAPFIPLRRLVRYRFHIVKTIERETNFLISNVFLKFSAWSQVKPLSNTLGATSLAALSELLSPDEIANMSDQKLYDFISTAGKAHFDDVNTVVDDLKTIARNSYRLNPKMTSTVNVILCSIIANIRALKASLRHIDIAIANEFKAFPNTLISVNGIGPVYAAGIYAEIGDIKLFPSDNALAKYAGLVWKRSQSGSFEAQDKNFLRASNKYLRYFLVEAANSLRIHNETFSAYYQKKFKEVPKHQHKRALVLSARKLVRLVFFLLKKNQLYHQADSQQSKAVN